MTTLNSKGSEAMLTAGVRAATDVTGFGFLGHLHRMLAASGVSATVRASAVPSIAGARELAAAGQIPGGSKRNRSYVEKAVLFADDVDEVSRVLLTDAQTSGGLLIACPASQTSSLRTALADRAVPSHEVGTAQEGPAGAIRIEA
jgi:selenide,water dikinase